MFLRSSIRNSVSVSVCGNIDCTVSLRTDAITRICTSQRARSSGPCGLCKVRCDAKPGVVMTREAASDYEDIIINHPDHTKAMDAVLG